MEVAAYLVLLAATLVVTFVKGRPAMRTIAVLLLLGNAATWIGGPLSQSALGRFSVDWFVIDLLFAVLLAIAAVLRPSIAAITIAAMQLNGVLGHLVKFVVPTTLSFGYAALVQIWAWPMVLMLLASNFQPRLSKMLAARSIRFAGRLPSFNSSPH